MEWMPPMLFAHGSAANNTYSLDVIANSSFYDATTIRTIRRNHMKFDTLVTSLGRNPHDDGGSVNPPVHHTSTLIFDDFKTMRDYEAGRNSHKGYGRHGTVTMDRLAQAIATLEGGDVCFLTPSGLSATLLPLLAFLGAGDHVLIPDSLYGSTRKFVDQELARFGIQITYYDPTIGADVAGLMQSNTKMIYVESPGSLTFEMQDIPAIAEAAHARGALVAADNTWATPIFQHPFDLGVDISVQSATKYISGHSDLVMGAVTCRQPHAKTLDRVAHNLGLCPGADNIYLCLRGLRTMMVRLRQHEKSALDIASWLEGFKQISRVMYPALPSDPGHALWKRDMSGACGLFGLEIQRASESQIGRVVDQLHHFGLGYSWGGYESLVTAYQPYRLRTATKWAEDTWIIRLHIGLEDVADLKEDLEQALRKL